MSLKLLFLFFLIQVSFQSISQTKKSDAALFSVLELQEDFNYWKKHLTDKHPLIYHYNSPQEFNDYFDSVYQEIDHPMTRSDFFRIIGPTTSFTKCGHTQVYAGSEINDYLMEDEHLIPVNIEWLKDTAYITYNYTDDIDLSPGTVITEINGIPIENIYSQCLSLLPDDGYSRSYAKFWTNKQFYYYYHLLFGLFEEYHFRTPSKDVVVKGMSVEEMDSIEQIKPKLVPDLFGGINHYFIDSLNTAVLRVGSFFNADYKSLHKKRFKTIADQHMEEILSLDCQYLIIDLRGNDGGQPSNPLYLLKYLMNEPFVFKQEVRTLKDKNETDSFNRSRKTIIPDGRVGIFNPFDSPYQGTIYLIVDGGATSAAAEFASVFHRYSRGKIIGTETGGNPIILSGYGLGASKKLPNTKLPLSFGNRTTLMNDYKLDNGYGLVPDKVINTSISDYLNGNDPHLEYILGEVEEFQKVQITK